MGLSKSDLPQEKPGAPSIGAIAFAAHAAGLCVVPAREDGSKRPIGAWKQYQTTRSTDEDLNAWYGPSTGIGVLCGAISGNLELFEFDERATYEAFKETAAASGLGDLVERIEAGYLEETPGGGIHWFYRCDEIAGNTPLARRPKRPDEMKHPADKTQVLIETRGEGGYAVVAPSCGGVHPSGKPYQLKRGGFD